MAARKTAKKAATATKTRARAAKSVAPKRATGGKKRAARPQSGGMTLSSVAPSFTVDDVEKSVAWYRDVLGFVLAERWEHDGKLMGGEMRAGRVIVMIGQDDWKKGRDRVKGEGFRLYCETAEDVDRLAQRIKARGGTLAQEPRDESWGARAFAVEDPDGFKITISTKR
jgi:uncharacterized glyoxalase superfamily protein PhnB